MSNLKKSTFYLIILTMVSKVLGFGREIVLLYFYGASLFSDVYIVSTGIVNTLFFSISSALATTFIPLFFEVDKLSREKSMRFYNNVLNIVVIISFIIMILGYIFTEEIVKIFAFNFEGEKLELTVYFTKIMIFSLVFLTISYMFSSWLHINENFVIPGITGIPYNIIIMITIFISTTISQVVMPIGVIIAIASQLIIQIPYIKKYNYKYQFYLNLNDEYIKKMLYLIAPVFIGMLTSNLNLAIDRSLASSLPEGCITILNSASRLNTFVTSIFISSISSILYTTLSRISSDVDNMNFRNLVSKSIKIIIVTIAPISTIFIILSQNIVKIVFERGEFVNSTTKMTAIALSIYSIGMLAILLRDFLNRSFYSLRETKTPMVNGIISVILNILLNILFIEDLGYIGLALATTISSILGVIILFVSFVKMIGSIDGKSILRTFIKVSIACIFMSIVIVFINKIMQDILSDGFLENCISLMACILLGGLVYIIILTFLFNKYKNKCKN